MNLCEKYAEAASGRSISQYDPPRCFELAGKEFAFALDTGEQTGDVRLTFIDGKTVRYDMFGKRTGEAQYECRKGDDYTYLVTYCLYEPRENHTFVIDTENKLVTFLRAVVGENPYYPYLIESHFGFGYIAVEGKEHTDLRRHGFTDDVVGTSIKWVYGHENATLHIYHDPHWYRITYPKDRIQSEAQMEQNKAFNDAMASLPSSDEPAYYIRIKEKLYLVSITEQNMEKLLADRIGFRSDTLCFLDNWDHIYSVGRGYGTMTRNGEDSEIFVMIGKYGVPEKADEHFFTDPIPFLV